MAVSVPPEAAGNLPPQNIEAEASVLGAILISDKALDAVQIDTRLRPADFYRERHRLIYQAMLDLKEKAVPEAVDVLTVCEQLQSKGVLEEAGGTAYVHTLPGMVPSAPNAPHYARIVKAHALRRELIAAAHEIQDKTYAFSGDTRELLEQAEARLFRIGKEDRGGELKSIGEILHVEVDKLEQISREGVSLSGTPSGFKDLDDLTGGFQPGNLIVLAARPAMGKCLAGSTLVYDPAAAISRRIDELVDKGEQGGDVWVLSMDSRLGLRRARATGFIRSGVQPVFRVTTRLGRELTASANHPLLTLEGWREVGELSAETPVAVTPGVGGQAPAVAAALAGSPSAGRPEFRPSPADIGTTDVAWDEIASIEPAGAEETFDLTIPGHHNFVADEFVVHNSALVTNMAENAAVDHGRPVALFSLEMSETELAQRFIASRAKLNGDDLRKGRVSADRWPKVIQATEKLAKAPLFVDDSSDIGIMELRAKARRLHNRHELGLLIVDYLQLMRPEDPGVGRVEQIGQISRGLKILARELEIPVIAVSQLSRAVEARRPPIPMLSDLRESGNIEQDADVVMFIYRDEYYNPDTTDRPGEADLIVAKHRNGPVDTKALTFIARHPKFANMYRDPVGIDPGTPPGP